MESGLLDGIGSGSVGALVDWSEHHLWLLLGVRFRMDLLLKMMLSMKSIRLVG
jgi:hypothetical protein